MEKQAPHFNAALLADASRPLMSWYQKEGRHLPWREDRDPYRIWISEIMLQQTRIEAVLPYYERFLRELPGIKELAQVPQERLLKLWEGLGYYSRARNLKKAASLLAQTEDGKMPADYEKILSLPGIGPYTAGAVASIAFRIPVPAVDGNVLRILARLCLCGEDVRKDSLKREAEEVLRGIMEERAASDSSFDPGVFNEAWMELGERVCLPNGRPLCDSCPVRAFCRACAENAWMDYPYRSPSNPRRQEERTILLFRAGGKTGIRKRPEKGLLAGLYEFPGLEGHLKKEELEAYLKAQSGGAGLPEIRFLCSAKHVFSHVEWNMIGYEVFLKEEIPGLVFVGEEELYGFYALPSAFRPFLRLKPHIADRP